MSVEYVRIAEEEDGEAIEIPTETDGTIILSSVNAQFPGVCGLKYRNPDTQSMRGIKLVDGILYPPGPDDSWMDCVYLTVYPKDNKRKMEDEDSQSVRSKRPAQKCSDLIVLGLPWKVEEKDLENYFQVYGNLVMTMVKRDDSGKSKGYGFIRYGSYEAQEQVIGKTHFIGGRKCEVKIPYSKQEEPRDNKIFVGRITESTTKENLKTYFEQFGVVDDVYIPTPFRSFAFVTFHENNIAQKLVGEDHVINGVSVYINNADPKGTKEQQANRRAGVVGSGMPFQSASFPGRGGSGMPNAARYFGNSGVGNQLFTDSRHSLPFSNPMAQSSSAGGSFNANSMGFNAVNPAAIAAALDSWNTMFGGMLAAGASQGRNASAWQNSNNDMKKDGNPGGWNGKGDTKWS